MDQTFQEVIEKIKHKYQLDFVALTDLTLLENHHGLKWKYASGNISMRFKRIVLQPGKGIAGIVYKTGKPIYLSNVNQKIQKEDLFDYPILVSEQLKSFCALPLYKHNTVRGVILLGFRTEDQMSIELYEEMLKNISVDFPNYHWREMIQS